ncbi:FeoA family protein [Lachnoclostridium sp. MSJ-17]|uniref:FeoA family protein n=1 Tax=Lachnoclostridium sp. MSJ-17 TaxID=2841516 RepID=UPI001C11F009|nr:FeoA family protein [Lachnoclostridium sp. MSJ-17]MBU5461976.1 ferrous iron transport protein A [Lachnoclostridium sp. MSJ-17]
MPLTLAVPGEQNIIKRIGGNAEVRAHLQNLGFVSGAVVTVICSMGGNLIVNVKDARIAVSREMAQKIYI